MTAFIKEEEDDGLTGMTPVVFCRRGNTGDSSKAGGNSVYNMQSLNLLSRGNADFNQIHRSVARP